MIDPASAIGIGTGAGGALGIIFRLFSMWSDNGLEKTKEKNRHDEALANQGKEYRLKIQETAILDKGEPYSYSILWGLLSFSGTKADRLVPPAYSGHLWLLATAYCWAIFVCFLCPDIVVFSRAIDNATSSWILIYGFIERHTPDRTVYIQTLAGVGASLLTTASFILSTAIVGFARKR